LIESLPVLCWPLLSTFCAFENNNYLNLIIYLIQLGDWSSNINVSLMFQKAIAKVKFYSRTTVRGISEWSQFRWRLVLAKIRSNMFLSSGGRDMCKRLRLWGKYYLNLKFCLKHTRVVNYCIFILCFLYILNCNDKVTNSYIANSRSLMKFGGSDLHLFY
jgi:hypothetical protein